MRVLLALMELVFCDTVPDNVVMFCVLMIVCALSPLEPPPEPPPVNRIVIIESKWLTAFTRVSRLVILEFKSAIVPMADEFDEIDDVLVETAVACEFNAVVLLLTVVVTAFRAV